MLLLDRTQYGGYMKILFIISAVLISTSCARTIDVNKLKERNYLWYAVNETKPYTGNTIAYYSNGQVKKTEQYKDGKSHGDYIAYYENGQIEEKVQYKDGKVNEREVIAFHENGQIKNRVPYKDGEPHGESTQYFSNGQVSWKVQYINGKIHGESIMYYESGNVFLKRQYKDGERHGEDISYYENGQEITLFTKQYLSILVISNIVTVAHLIYSVFY